MNFFHANKGRPYHVSAGCVVFNPSSGEILLARKIHDREYGFTKGTLEDDETLELCARRETREEVGYDSEIIDYLGAITYQVDSYDFPFEKTVHFFVAKVIGSKLDHFEVDSQWFTYDQALQELKDHGYPEEAEIAERAISSIKSHAGA